MALSLRGALVAVAVFATAALLGVTGASAEPIAHRQVRVGDRADNLTLAAPTVLAASGPPVATGGNGDNEAQGVFVALCEIPDSVGPNDSASFTAVPTSCLGTHGQGGTSHRVVNGVIGQHASGYLPGGSFVVDRSHGRYVPVDLR
ncbi:hypothetical protein [Kutzneria buriramensis]|uniref:Uncharacterized protein n=1 Tax=Kutzneria buriramensis TaxID=1045776 RepID=A0A3E0G7S7_9PSEU|nr:hypothetical protein [Kutzneria buriramensis]REH17867.1 hypothetical protein BCF44_1427 [Kutzneria buriramensis]